MKSSDIWRRFKKRYNKRTLSTDDADYTDKRESDPFLVEFEPGRKTFDSFMELSFLLEKMLKHRIELVTVESLSPYIGPHILKEVEYVALAA